MPKARADVRKGHHAFDKEIFKNRNALERMLDRLKEFRCIAMCYDKMATANPEQTASFATTHLRKIKEFEWVSIPGEKTLNT